MRSRNKTGVWRAYALKEAQKTIVNHQLEDEYAVDTIVDSKWYRNWYLNDLLPAVIEESMPRTETLDLTVQQDGAVPRIGKDI